MNSIIRRRIGALRRLEARLAAWPLETINGTPSDELAAAAYVKARATRETQLRDEARRLRDKLIADGVNIKEVLS